MSTARETILSALETALVRAFRDMPDQTDRTIVFRDPEKAPDANAAGILVMHDGDPKVESISLSPVTYEFDHDVPLDCSAVGETRRDVVDAMQLTIDDMLKADRTLGGLVTDARVMEAPVISETDPAEGVETIRYALVMVKLQYISSSPTG